MRDPVFITARFRTGSTLLWNIFRQIPEVSAYYEPLHEQLLQMRKANIAPQPQHDFVDRYFDEYAQIETLESTHSSDFGVYQLYLEAEDSHPQLKTYIQSLLDGTADGKKPVLQFNRVDFRLPWLKANFPQVPIIHLYRSPREQWLSTIADNPTYCSTDLDTDPYLITTWARDLYQQFPFLANPWIRHPYQRHYYLWKLSYLAGHYSSNLSISYETLLADPENSVEQLLETANLPVEPYLERCLGMIVQKPVSKWKTYHDEAWFLDLEQDCEQMLDRLGLNQQFGQKPLADIVQQSQEYQGLLDDVRAHAWQIQSSQRYAIALKVMADDKESVISELHSNVQAQRSQAVQLQHALQAKDTALQAKDDAIVQLRRDAQEAQRKERVISQLKSAADERLDRIAQLEQTLAEKENYLNSLEGFCYGSLNKPWTGRVRSKLTKLGFRPPSSYRCIWDHPAGHCSPIPLKLPRHYYKTKLNNPRSLPVVSIVTPSFNQGDYIERTITSVLDQKYPNLEYVIQDGGSTDATLDVLERYRAHVRHVESRPDQGQTHALNLGFAHTGGDIMAYLNSDDMLLPGAIAAVVNYFEAHPEVDVVYGHRILVDEHDRDLGRWITPHQTHDYLKWADYVPQETMFWRRSIWNRIGGSFDQSFRFAMDWDLLMRFEQAGAKFARLPRFLGAFRRYPEQKTTAWSDIGEQEMSRLRQRYHHRLITQFEVDHWIRPFVHRMRWEYGLYYFSLRRY